MCEAAEGPHRGAEGQQPALQRHLMLIFNYRYSPI